MDWFVLRSHHNKEDLLCKQVCAEGIDVYYPKMPAHPVNPRARKVIPYFPGYMFVQVDLAKRGLSVFQWMPFAVGLVCFGDEPASVPESFIQLLQEKVAELIITDEECFKGFKKGDAVTINSGPFASYPALFDHRIPGSERVRVLLKMLSDRQVPVELDGKYITRPAAR